MDGVEFGRYRLIELLGRGGMGEVWRAHDSAIDRTVAIKMLLPHFAQDEKFEQRFRREAHAAARLDDPHVVPIYDVGEIDGRLFVSMRLINGADLQTLLDAGPLEPQRAVGIIEQIAKALHAAHRAGLIHRDIKPSNILVAEDDFAYLIDFGIARAAGETGLTSTGATIGTWSYMAPERFSTGQAEASSDIYALACVLYQCLTGELPFPAVALEQIAVAHMTTAPPKPSVQRPSIPASMDSVIATGLAKEPSARHATTIELAEAARNAINTSDSRTPATPSQPKASASRPATTPPSAPTSHPDTLPSPPVTPTPRTRASATAATQQARPARPPNNRSPAPSPRSAAPTIHESGRWRRKSVVIPAAVLTAAAVTAATFVLLRDNGPKVSRPVSASGSSVAALPPSPYGPQTVLPFNGINRANGIAVDATGAVYVSDAMNVRNSDDRVLKLAPGSTGADVLPLAGIEGVFGVAADSAGDLYVIGGTSNGTQRVLKFPAGSPRSEVLPFPDLGPGHSLEGVAVDNTGAVFVTDSPLSHYAPPRVMKLAAGSSRADVLPFAELDSPGGVAVDSAGAVYITDKNRVLKLAAGSTRTDVLPVAGSKGVAVDARGAVYVLNGNKVLKLAAGAARADALPFAGLTNPLSVAVADNGSVYVTNEKQVLKLPLR
nr:serine/threonine-protein kinase [Mycobacterium gordonae]